MPPFDRSARPHADTLTSLPSRGIHAIDELKSVSRLEELHVVGIDPGIREIVVAVDQDDPKGGSPVRYTQQQRLRDMRSRQYTDEGRRTKPCEVAAAEQSLADHNSRSADLCTFCAYCRKRHAIMEECLAFYAEKEHRQVGGGRRTSRRSGPKSGSTSDCEPFTRRRTRDNWCWHTLRGAPPTVRVVSSAATRPPLVSC